MEQQLLRYQDLYCGTSTTSKLDPSSKLELCRFSVQLPQLLAKGTHRRSLGVLRLMASSVSEALGRSGVFCL